MRDGVGLATDVYCPPQLPAPTVVFRTPYGRGLDPYVGVFMAFARRGYVVVSQDCRGTGDSEPDSWDYYVFEPDDGYDLVGWVTEQSWFSGFLTSFGSSYSGQTQWHMSRHPKMSAIAPEVSGLGVAINTAHLHMFVSAYARSVGKGDNKVSIPFSELEHVLLGETLASGYFNDPLEPPLPESVLGQFSELSYMSLPEARAWLWARYCALSCAERAKFLRQAMGVRSVTFQEIESAGLLFGQSKPHDAHTIPHVDPEEAG